MRIRHRLEYIATRGFMLFAMLSPLPLVWKVADVVGAGAYALGMRRKVTLDNLRLAFPEKTSEELTAIAKSAYRQFGRMLFEFMRFPALDSKTVLESCEIVNRHLFDEALASGKGGVLVAGHFGNWELMGAHLARLGYPIYFLVGEQRNRLVDDVMNKHRERMGIRIIHRGIAVRGVIRALRDNGFVAMLADQDARSAGEFVEFFGRPASTFQGPAVFALKTGASIFFGGPIRIANGRHRIEVERFSVDGMEAVTPENIRQLTQAYTSALERIIRRYPDHWFWMHRRWKSSPEKV
jgi:Kdo2-lipid IVA lauroyltransferase/acyltransferase